MKNFDLSSLQVWMNAHLSFSLFNIEAWRWLVFLTAMVISLGGSKIVEWFINGKIRQIQLPAARGYDTKLIDLITPVVRWAILLYVAHHGFKVLQLSGDTQALIVEFFKIGYALLVAFFASRMVQLLLDIWGQNTTDESADQLKGSLIPAIAKIANGLIIVLTILLILQNAGYNIMSLLAGLGIGGIAVALAAQETLANLFGSITIFVDKSFRVGDRIVISSFDGIVERIGLRCTQLRLLDGTLTSIPNKVVTQTPFTNISRRPTIRHDFVLNLTYDTTQAKMQEAIAILREIYQAHPLTADVIISWRDYSAYSLDIPINYWCRTTDYKVFLQAVEEINFQIKNRFVTAGLKFAFPTQTQIMQSE